MGTTSQHTSTQEPAKNEGQLTSPTHLCTSDKFPVNSVEDLFKRLRHLELELLGDLFGSEIANDSSGLFLKLQCRSSSIAANPIEQDSLDELKQEIRRRFRMLKLSDIEVDLIVRTVCRVRFKISPSGTEARERTLRDIESLRAEIDTCLSQGELFSSPTSHDNCGNSDLSKLLGFQDHYEKYRGIFRSLAYLRCMPSYFSPTSRSSTDGQLGSTQANDRKGISEPYERWPYPELEEVSRLLSTSSPFSNYSDTSTTNYVLPSAQSSLMLALRGLYIEFDKKVEVVCMNGLNWEGEILIQDHSKRCKWNFEYLNGNEISTTLPKLAKLNNGKNLLMCLAPFSLSPDFSVTKIDQVLACLSNPEIVDTLSDNKRTITLLVDLTLCPNLRLTTNPISNNPSLRVITIQSLHKLSMDGMELGGAGLFIASGNFHERFFKGLASSYKHEGLAPTREMVEQLWLLCNLRSLEISDGRLDFLANTLKFSNYLRRLNSPLFSVHTGNVPNDSDETKTSVCDQIPPPLAFLLPTPSFAENCPQMDSFGEFSSSLGERLISSARDHGVNLHQGTSFGFNETRFSIIKIDSPLAPWAVRVAVGKVETNLSLELLAHCFVKSFQQSCQELCE